jgi:hypothetical protein
VAGFDLPGDSVGEDIDGDGLPDSYELLVTGTDPTNPDTWHTGRSDGYKDSDGDGWTNLDEMRNGTNPNLWNAPMAGQRQLLVATGDNYK